MTVVAQTPITPYKTTDQLGVGLISWLLLLNGNTGAPERMTNYPMRSLQVTGTWGVGGTLVWEGSNDNVTYFTLYDPYDVACSITGNSLICTMYPCLWVRPHVTAGDVTTSLNAIMCCVGTFKP